MCLTPVNIKKQKFKTYREDNATNTGTDYYAYNSVPCGKCPDCRMQRAKGWIFRLQQQEKVQHNSLFLTLTLAPENVLMTHNGFMTLHKPHYQNFMKRLRKNTGRKTIKYYACGEYGSTTMRPHYHAIIFDCTHAEVEKAWGLGNIFVGTTTSDSIAYVTKYMCKIGRIPLFETDDRTPEFSLMSKNMGLNYLTPQVIKWHEENQASYLVHPGGYKSSLPRYYRDKIFTAADRENINAKNAHKYNTAFELAVKQAGSIEQYYSNRYYAVQAIIKKSQKINPERDKI